MLQKIFQGAKEIIIIFGLALLISLLVKGFLVDNRMIPTSSMVPTVPVNSRILVNRIGYYIGEPQFQDIVLFEPTASIAEDVGLGEDMLKRVIGMPGDEIYITGGVLYLNGEALEEPYISAPMNYDFGPVKVPEDCVLLLGDNRNYSFDAHLWKDPFVPIENIKGKAFFIYWPMSEFGGLE